MGKQVMKIQNKFKTILGLSLLIAATGFIFFNLRHAPTPIVYKRHESVEAQMNVNSMTFDEGSDLYCGILLMPKSLLPILKILSRHEIAEKIKILPANIEWENGHMRVIPKKSILKDNQFNIDQFERENNLSKNTPQNLLVNPPEDLLVNTAEEKIVEADIKKLNPVLLYYFLANASKNKINY
jgi:hypothetical protein